MSKPILWIVIPCYNEEQVLPITAPMFLQKITSLTEKGNPVLLLHLRRRQRGRRVYCCQRGRGCRKRPAQEEKGAGLWFRPRIAKHGGKVGGDVLAHPQQRRKAILSSGKCYDYFPLKLAAIWLNAHGMPNVQALQTGKAAALRIKVPVLDQHKPFEEANMNDVETCFKAVQELSNLATALGQITAATHSFPASVP